MLARTHVAFGLFVLLALGQFFNFSSLFVISFFVGIFFLDIDNRNSKLGRKFFSKVFMAFSKHRGFLHSFAFLFLSGFFLSYLSIDLMGGFCLGGFVHLVLDMLTLRGVRPFWPLSFRVRGIIRTGGRMEDFIFLLFFLLDLAMIFFKLYYLLLLNL